MRTFEQWLETLDVHKIEPYTKLDSQYDISIFLELAWEEGFTEGYDRAEIDTVDKQKFGHK